MSTAQLVRHVKGKTMFSASVMLDGIHFNVEVKEGDVAFLMPNEHMEEVSLSCASATILASMLFAAVNAIEEKSE